MLETHTKCLEYISTLEDEYMTIIEAVKVALSLKGLVREFGLNQGGVRLHCYNQCHLLGKVSGLSC